MMLSNIPLNISILAQVGLYKYILIHIKYGCIYRDFTKSV